MSTARNPQIDDDPLALIAAYGEILSLYGPDSDHAKDFIRSHPGRDDLFEDLTAAALRLRKAAADRDLESRDQRQFLMSTVWLARLLCVSLLLLVAASASLFFFVSLRNEREKNIQILEFTNRAIAPFVYYKIPMSQHDKRDTLRIYEGVNDLARRLPPKHNRNVWSKQLLYAWVRAAFVNWLDATPASAEEAFWLDAVRDRIRYIKDEHPDFARIYSLEAQLEYWQGKSARDRMSKAAEESTRALLKQEAKNHYERSVELNRQAIKIDKDLTLAYNNLANVLLDLGPLANDLTTRMNCIDEARQAAENAVSQAKLLFLQGQESTFTTYLDTLGDCYEALLAHYEETGQLEKQKALIHKAFPIYTEITWDYYEVDFKNMSDQKDAERYIDHRDKNQKRFRKYFVLAHEQNADKVPEFP